MALEEARSHLLVQQFQETSQQPQAKSWWKR
jgi:hypothetical protein